ncbi:MAG: translation elongation factor-like protein [Acidimicrobiia bacterium]
MSEQQVGTVSHYFTNAQVAAIELTGDLKLGDTVRIVGHTSDFTQQIDSMQIEREDVEAAGSGDHIGIKVGSKARQNDKVFRVD